MNIPTHGIQRQRLLILVLVLSIANILFWGKSLFADFPEGARYATGTGFATDGTVLYFSSKTEFKDEHFSFGGRVQWKDKRNFMQETGTATHGWLGELNVNLQKGSNIGPPLLAEVELDDQISFDRSYMQGGNAKISLLPLSGGFDQSCYYLLYLKKVHCGSHEQRSLPKPK